MLRTLDIKCWTYFDRVGTEDASLQNLTHLKTVSLSLSSDGTVVPRAMESLVSKLPPLKGSLNLVNRGCHKMEVDPDVLPSRKELWESHVVYARREKRAPHCIAELASAAPVAGRGVWGRFSKVLLQF